jgi:hypothetical protein
MSAHQLREKLPILLDICEHRADMAFYEKAATAGEHGLAFATLCCAAALFDLADHGGTDTSGLKAALERIADAGDHANGVREREGRQ